MNKISIVHRTQFGYHTDVYKWCEYLNDTYHIDMICFDEGRPKYTMKNVTVHYGYGKGGKIVRWICFMVLCFLRLSLFRGIILVSHFRESAFLKKMMPWRKMILDIRTFSINPDNNKRYVENEKLFNSVKLYDYITVISEGLRAQLPKSKELSSVLPLGGEIIELPHKRYDRLDMLYVGTFFNRHLEETIKGFAIAKKKLPEIEMIYHIVGDGPNGEEEKLKLLCKKLAIENDVVFYGRLPHDQLPLFYEKCNIGVSYVPIVSYYEYQPVTKTFEYIMAGLYTIATATQSNKEIINKKNGYLIEDDAHSFANALINIAESKDLINDSDVRRSLESYTWELIVNNIMKPLLSDVGKKLYK
mgnify:CR=1 FL=1